MSITTAPLMSVPRSWSQSVVGIIASAKSAAGFYALSNLLPPRLSPFYGRPEVYG